ncbi:MAG: elongation factor G [Bacteroidales bacterium]|nr:elongation factor G [Bacteroidales bacterium]MCF8454885.1 elongation factor G [Bacteroidales bacterium]
MKVYESNQIKNISLVGNTGSGKTTLAECILFQSGLIDRRGDVGSKNTVSDYNDIEHENENSIFSTVLYAEWKGNKINIIDNPGLDDFVGGSITAYAVSDLAVMLVNAQNGVEVGTEIQGRHASRLNKPMMFVVNHLDHDKANFEKTFEALKERFGGNTILAQYPIDTGAGFNSIIDVVKMKMYKYPADGGKAEVLDIPAGEKDKAEALHAELIEKAAESDESLMELFFENETLTDAEMTKGISDGLIQRGLFPVFCVSAKANKGVDRLLDFLAETAPTSVKMPGVQNSEGQEIKCDPKGPASLFFFKTSIEQHIGEVLYFKVMSGSISETNDLTNYTNNTKERISQIFACSGRKREKVTTMHAGDIGGTVKLKNTKTDHTLNAAGNDWTFPAVKFPEPKYRAAIRTLAEGDEEKMAEALNKMHQIDPTIKIEFSKELKQIIVHGQGEYHLNILKWHLDNIYKIETEYISPKIPYRETITKAAPASYRHKKQSGGSGQFGEVHMVIEPYIEGQPDPSKFKINGKETNISVRGKDEIELKWGGKLIYYNCIVGGSIDARFLPAILKGIMEKMEEGPLTGSYARDIRVSVYDGKMHPVDSNEISFKLAGRNAFRQAFKEAGPKIMEPVYQVEVLVPSEYMGDVMSDLQGRRSIIEGMSSESGYEKLKARVPLAEMNKYSTALSSITSGRATYTMSFASYEPVPGDIQEKLLKDYEAEEEED